MTLNKLEIYTDFQTPDMLMSIAVYKHQVNIMSYTIYCGGYKKVEPNNSTFLYFFSNRLL